MKEGVGRGVLVKGGRFLESLAAADAVVFDKTGTLTESRPRVAEVIPGEGYERDDILRTAACLEEHFPHPVARAVVRKAEQEGLHHQEEHTEVEYVVAHGIASRLHAAKVAWEPSLYPPRRRRAGGCYAEDIERLFREGRLILSGGGRETGRAHCH
ncbi:MAG: HAD family hydrolase [Bilophila wadsworthia]